MAVVKNGNVLLTLWGISKMKYHEIHNVEFVQCYKIDEKKKQLHVESELTNDGCSECMGLYDDLRGDLCDEFESDNKDRAIKDIVEISHEPDTNRLSFALWSIPNN